MSDHIELFGPVISGAAYQSPAQAPTLDERAQQFVREMLAGQRISEPSIRRVARQVAVVVRRATW